MSEVKNAAPQKQKSSGKRTAKKSRKGTAVAAVAAGAAVVVCAFLGAVLFGYQEIYPGVTVDGLEVGKLDREQVLTLLQQEYADRQQALGQVSIIVNGEQHDLDISNMGAAYNLEQTADNACAYGRDGNIFHRAGQVAAAFFGGADIQAAIDVDPQMVESQMDDVAAQVSQQVEQPSYVLEGDKLVIDRGQSGYEVDKQQLSQLVLERLTQGSNEPIEYTAPVAEPEPVDLQAIHDEVAGEMHNAYLDLASDPTGNTIAPSQAGADFDIQQVQALLDSSDQRIVEAPVEFVAPQITTEDLQSKLFRDTLGSCTTKFNAGLVGRTTNVKLAASHINGTILNPGDVFSYNDVVGPRTYATGFKDATVFANGGAEDGVGGGICQVSSTLYVATLKADMEIVERRNHSLHVTYVPLGQDATVAYGAVDFRFRNNTEYPIKVVAGTSGSSLTVSLVGTQTQNKKVEIVTQTLSSDPFQTIYEDDPSLEPGKTKTKTGGYPGYKTVSYRVVYVDGKEVSRTLENNSTYKRVDKVILRGPEKPAEQVPEQPVDPPAEKPADPTPQPDPEPPTDPTPADPTPEEPPVEAPPAEEPPAQPAP